MGRPIDGHLARASRMTFEPIMANSSQAMQWAKGMNSGGSTYIWPGLPHCLMARWAFLTSGIPTEI